MVAPAVVEFAFGLGSRYSYLAATQIGRVRQKSGCELVWTPLSSNDRLVLLEDYLGKRR